MEKMTISVDTNQEPLRIDLGSYAVLKDLNLHNEQESYTLINSNSLVSITGTMNFSGKAVSFFSSWGGSIAVSSSAVLTFNGEVTAGTAQTGWGGHIQCHTPNVSGKVTGRRYYANRLSLIETYGGASYFPGTVAGLADSKSGGFYI